MRFHLDEHVNQAIARGLRRRGVDVTTSVDVSLLGESDERHIEFARQNERVIFTQDVDYLHWHRQGLPYAGIVYASPESRSVGEIVRFLCLLHEGVEQQAMQKCRRIPRI